MAHLNLLAHHLVSGRISKSASRTAAWHRGTLTNLTCRCPCPRIYAAGQRHGCRAQPDHIPSLRS